MEQQELRFLQARTQRSFTLTVQENCEDIYADAKTINETKYNTEEVVLDSVDENEEA